jgi:hypothetical protein
MKYGESMQLLVTETSCNKVEKIIVKSKYFIAPVSAELFQTGGRTLHSDVHKHRVYLRIQKYYVGIYCRTFYMMGRKIDCINF